MTSLGQFSERPCRLKLNHDIVVSQGVNQSTYEPLPLEPVDIRSTAL